MNFLHTAIVQTYNENMVDNDIDRENSSHEDSLLQQSFTGDLDAGPLLTNNIMKTINETEQSEGMGSSVLDIKLSAPPSHPVNFSTRTFNKYRSLTSAVGLPLRPPSKRKMQAVSKVASSTQEKAALEASRKALQDTQNALKELQAEFDAYKKEKADYDKLHNETFEKVQHSLSEMRVANMKQLDYATERYKIIQDNDAGYKKEIYLLQDRNHKLILKLESSVAHFKETSWSEQERVYKEEIKMLEMRCDELTKQNSALHEQMSKLSSQVVSIQQSSGQHAGASPGTPVRDEQGKTSQQLLEVIRILRREKEIAETKLQVVQTECSRIKQWHTSLEKQLEEVSKNLAEERQRSQVNAKTVANQMELMRKVEEELLRDERDQLLNSKQELESNVHHFGLAKMKQHV